LSVNLDKDSSFEFNLPEGLSEVTLLKLENDLKGRIKKGGAAVSLIQNFNHHAQSLTLQFL